MNYFRADLHLETWHWYQNTLPGYGYVPEIPQGGAVTVKQNTHMRDRRITDCLPGVIHSTTFFFKMHKTTVHDKKENWKLKFKLVETKTERQHQQQQVQENGKLLPLTNMQNRIAQFFQKNKLTANRFQHINSTCDKRDMKSFISALRAKVWTPYSLI